jgi:hypothetical protein
LKGPIKGVYPGSLYCKLSLPEPEWLLINKTLYSFSFLKY